MKLHRPAALLKRGCNTGFRHLFEEHLRAAASDCRQS